MAIEDRNSLKERLDAVIREFRSLKAHLEGRESPDAVSKDLPEERLSDELPPDDEPEEPR